MTSKSTIATLAAAVTLAALPATASAAEGEDIGGFYIGVHAGLGSDSSDWAGTANPNPVPPFTSANTAGLSASGALFGGTIGGRWQSGYLVLGIEAEASFANLDDSAPNTSVAGFANSAEIDWLGTLTAQAGIHTGRVHGYLEAGIAFTGSEYRVTDSRGGPVNLTQSVSDTRNGFVFGAGLEYLLGSHWSIRGEYNYLNFGANDYRIANDSWSIDQTMHVGRVAFLYRF
ncbi:MAG: porin family protein [Sphingomonas sp.]|nr:porin family protein [Sphingomonas sp.]